MVERSSFAVACVMAFAGLVPAVGAGCSSEAKSTAPAADAGGIPDDGSKGDASREGLCPSTENVDVSNLPFKPPRVIPGSCSNDDIAFFFVTVGTGISVPSIKQVMERRNAECAACIFGAADADTWAPIVFTGDGEHIENVGGCFAVVSGNDACGKASQATSRCVQAACGACDESEARGCSDAVRDEGGVCAEPFTEYLIECGPDPDAISKTCVTERTYQVEGSIVRQCGGAKPDAGAP